MDNDWGELDKVLDKLPLENQGGYDASKPIIEPPRIPLPEEGSDGR